MRSDLGKVLLDNSRTGRGNKYCVSKRQMNSREIKKLKK